MSDSEFGEEFGVQVPQVVVGRRGPQRARSSTGERGPQKPGRQMGCLGAEVPSNSEAVIYVGVQATDRVENGNVLAS
jgi:hypothetical protein